MVVRVLATQEENIDIALQPSILKPIVKEDNIETELTMGTMGGGNTVSTCNDNPRETPRHHDCLISDLVRSCQGLSCGTNEGKPSIGPSIPTRQNPNAIVPLL
jgi:hypothetical protein